MNRQLFNLNLNRKAVAYLIVAQTVYGLYELAIANGQPHDGNALALGLLLVAITLPTCIPYLYLGPYIEQFIGYLMGYTDPFWPRLVAWQLLIILNFCFFNRFLNQPKNAAELGSSAPAKHMQSDDRRN